MQRADIIDFWGRDNLKRWSGNDLRHVAIPESSKSYLVEVGLPFRADWNIRFDDAALRLPQLPNKPSYRRIGFQHFLPICLDEKRNGCAVIVEDEIGRTEGYINSSVELFGECLVYYQQYRLIARGSEDDIRAVVALIDRRMRKADPTAFANVDDCYWPGAIQLMTEGML
jgi:hypothetical protein